MTVPRDQPFNRFDLLFGQELRVHLIDASFPRDHFSSGPIIASQHHDALDTYRDLLAGALDAYLSVVSNNLNQVMRTLTAWSIILMSVTLIASVYGMNVALWPTNGSILAGVFSLTLMGAIGAALFVLFKGIDWI